MQFANTIFLPHASSSKYRSRGSRLVHERMLELRLQELDKSKICSSYRCAPWCVRNVSGNCRFLDVPGATGFLCCYLYYRVECFRRCIMEWSVWQAPFCRRTLTRHAAHRRACRSQPWRRPRCKSTRSTSGHRPARPPVQRKQRAD